MGNRISISHIPCEVAAARIASIPSLPVILEWVVASDDTSPVEMLVETELGNGLHCGEGIGNCDNVELEQ